MLYEGEDAPLRYVKTDYCMYGHTQQKPTAFLISRELDTSWVRTCPLDGSCGAMTRPAGPGSALEHGGQGAASYADAAIPAGFCTELTAAWRRHHAKKRGEGGNADELEAAQTGPFHGRTTRAHLETMHNAWAHRTDYERPEGATARPAR